jgi:glycosyltransferase involved in cell wall biosynthesis
MTAPRSLIIVENLPLPRDRRVWQEAQALRDAGHVVSIICPKDAKHTESYVCIDGIHIFRHPVLVEAETAKGYAVEYTNALFWEFVLSLKVYWKNGFDTVQACNPPDLIFIVGAFWKYLFGKPFIFDHHDINPELFEAKFGRRGFFYKLMVWLERMTFKMSDVSIATNETFKDIAIGRGGMAEDNVFIVQSTPHAGRFRRQDPEPRLRNGRRIVVGYVGIMGAQDGVDLLVGAMDHIVNRLGREDIQCVIAGTGTEVAALKAQVRAANLLDHVTFTGFLSHEELLKTLSTYDIGVVPDRKNPFNDAISMNKIFEYMTLGIPFVSFNLVQGRRTGGDAGIYTEADNCPRALADGILKLADDNELRAEKAALSKARGERLLDWNREKAQLLAAYEKARSRGARGAAQSVPATSS